ASPRPYTLTASTARAATERSRDCTGLGVRVSVNAMSGSPSLVTRRRGPALTMRSSPRRRIGPSSLIASAARRSRNRTSRTGVHLGMYACIGRQTDVCDATCRYVEPVETAPAPLIVRATRWLRDLNPTVIDAVLGTVLTVFGLIGLWASDTKAQYRDPD